MTEVITPTETDNIAATAIATPSIEQIEKKPDAVKDESKAEEVTPEKTETVTNDSKPEDKKTEEKTEKKENDKVEEPPKEPEIKEEGYLLKHSKTLFVYKTWNKSYFAFGSDAINLDKLKFYHKKNLKKGGSKVSSTPNTQAETSDTTTTEPSKTTTDTTDTTTTTEPKAKTADEQIKPADEQAKTSDEQAKAADEQAKAADEQAKAADEPTKVADTTTTEPTTKVDEPPTTSDIVEEEKKEPEEKKESDDKKQSDTKDSEVKEEDKKPAETKIDEHNHYIFKNIAHASQTGEGLLFYYKTKTDAENKNPSGIINLKEIKEIKKISESTKQYAFKIETSYRDFELAAESELERDSWIKTIEQKRKEFQESCKKTEDSDGYKSTYENLLKGTAFEVSKTSELPDEPFSGDDEQTPEAKPRSADTKRKSFIPGFFSGRKLATETNISSITETNDDDKKVTTTETTATGSDEPKTEKTETKVDDTKTGEPKSPQSPQKSSLFHIPSFFKRDTTTTTDDAKKDDKDDAKKDDAKKDDAKKDDAKKDDVKKDDTKKDEEAVNAETSTAAVNGAETIEPSEEKDKKVETTPQRENSGFFKFFKKTKEETPKDEEIDVAKAESAEPSTEVTSDDKEKKDADKTVETPKKEKEKEKEKEKKDKKKDKKKEAKKEEKEDKKEEKEEKEEGAKKDDDSSSDSSSDASEEPAKEGLVRRVTTKIFGGKRKSPKAEQTSRETPAAEATDKCDDKIEEVEENKEDKEKDEAKSTEKAEATTSAPESSGETEDKKKPFSIFGRRKSGTVGKKETSESQGEQETAVTTATEATDEKTDKDKEKETESAAQKSVFPEDIKKGFLRKQVGGFGGIIKSEDQRYFLLTKDKKLMYYKSDKDTSNPKSIDLSESKISVGEGSKFDIETKSRTYKLTAKSDEERESWIKELESAGATIVPSEKEPKKTEEATKLEVPKSSENENDIQKSVENAADQAADAANATVSETTETTTKATKETSETGETIVTETTTTITTTETSAKPESS